MSYLIIALVVFVAFAAVGFVILDIFTDDATWRDL